MTTFAKANKMTIGVFKMIHEITMNEKLTEEIIKNVRDQTKAGGIIAYLNGDVGVGEVGFNVITTSKNECDLEIFSICVLEVYRKRHIALDLINHLISEYKKIENSTIRNIHVSIPSDNDATMSLFDKTGFVKGDETDGKVKFSYSVPKS